MSSISIPNVYEIRKFSDSFYDNYPVTQYPEILREEDRPYDVIMFETNEDYYVFVPFRTFLNHNQRFHFDSVSLKSK